MARRRQLRGCAANLAEMLASRNFDVSGYWGMGFLYKLCLDRGLTSITIDIRSDEHSIWEDVVDQIGEAYRADLNRQLELSNIPHGWVKKAEAIFEFDIEKPSEGFSVQSNRGDLFCITVNIRSDLDRSWGAKRYGYCDPQGRCFELRSNRVSSQM